MPSVNAKRMQEGGGCSEAILLPTMRNKTAHSARFGSMIQGIESGRCTTTSDAVFFPNVRKKVKRLRCTCSDEEGRAEVVEVGLGGEACMRMWT
jgi:hypothetical protein